MAKAAPDTANVDATKRRRSGCVELVGQIRRRDHLEDRCADDAHLRAPR